MLCYRWGFSSDFRSLGSKTISINEMPILWLYRLWIDSHFRNGAGKIPAWLIDSGLVKMWMGDSKLILEHLQGIDGRFSNKSTIRETLLLSDIEWHLIEIEKHTHTYIKYSMNSGDRRNFVPKLQHICIRELNESSPLEVSY